MLYYMVRIRATLRQIRWRRRTLVRRLFAYAQLVFAGIILQVVVPESQIRGVAAVMSFALWVGMELLALGLDGVGEGRTS